MAMNGIGASTGLSSLMEQQKQRISEQQNNTSKGNNSGSASDVQSGRVKQYKESLKRLQENLQETTKDASLSQEEKNAKRQEIQQQIAMLNQQIHQAEQQSKNKQTGQEDNKVGQSAQSTAGTQEENQTSTLAGDKEEVIGKQSDQSNQSSSGQMEAMVVSDNAINLQKSTKQVADKLENHMKILGGEMRLDEARGHSVEAKKGEQEALADKVNNIRSDASKRWNIAQKRAQEKREEQMKKEQKLRFIQSSQKSNKISFEGMF